MQTLDDLLIDILPPLLKHGAERGTEAPHALAAFKMDVEGLECNVLAGAQSILSAYRPDAMLIEASKGYTELCIERHADIHGYTIRKWKTPIGDLNLHLTSKRKSKTTPPSAPSPLASPLAPSLHEVLGTVGSPRAAGPPRWHICAEYDPNAWQWCQCNHTTFFGRGGMSPAMKASADAHDVLRWMDNPVALKSVASSLCPSDRLKPTTPSVYCALWKHPFPGCPTFPYDPLPGHKSRMSQCVCIDTAELLT